jgi:hypothetical protein
MFGEPQLLYRHTRPKRRISVLLIDWGVRESFHSLHYLNRQTVDRDQYELIWLEFYNHKPQALLDLVAGSDPHSPVLDQWLVLGYPKDYIFHKHRLYNAGILAASGDICVICDSDAIFRPTFIQSLLDAFARWPNDVIHLDEVRNTSRDFYPFNHPSIDEILGPGCINWRGTTSFGLDDSPDMIHHANYGACMAARRRDLLVIGGADEHLDYLGYVCGPYELTFRLGNYGRDEHWLRDEYLYHTWHPNQYGFNTDYQGPHDGAHMALLALDARATFRTRPCLANPWYSQVRGGRPLAPERLLQLVGDRPEPTWQAGCQPSLPSERVYKIEHDYFGFDIYCHADRWHALPTGAAPLDAGKLKQGRYRHLWQASSQPDLRELLPTDPERWQEQQKSGAWPVRMWRKFRSQPLHHLPWRIARSARRLVAS